MTSELVRRLRARLDCFAVERDPEIVLDVRAVVEAEQIMDAVGEQLLDHAEAVALVGRLRWYRFHLLPAPEDRSELDEVIRLFGVLVEQRQDLVPPPVLAVLRPEPDSASAAALLSLVDEFLTDYGQGGPVDALHAAAALLCRAGDASGEMDGFADRAAEILRYCEQLSGPGLPRDAPPTGDCAQAAEANDALARSAMASVVRSLVERVRHPSATREAGAVGPDQAWGQVSQALRVVELARTTVQDFPATQIVPADQVTTLASMLLELSEDSDESAVLDEAIRVLTYVVANSVSPHDPDFAVWACRLALALRHRYRRTGAPNDLDEAVEWCRRATAVAPPRMVDVLYLLGSVLVLRGERTGARADRDEATAVLRRVVEQTTLDDPQYRSRLALLATALGQLGEQTADAAALEEAVRIRREVLSLIPESHPEFHRELAGLALALRRLSDRTGELTLLDEAILTARHTIALAPEGASDYPHWLSNLAVMLRARYERVGMVADLDEAVEAARTGVSSMRREEGGVYADMLSNLGLVLRTRAERSGAAADLDEAISAHRQSLAALPPDHPERPNRLTNLALALRTRHQRNALSDDLLEAIELSRQALRCAPSDHPSYTRWASTLALMQRSLFEASGDISCLAEAAELMRMVVDQSPEEHSGMPGQLLNLGGVLAEYAAAAGGVIEEYTVALAILEQVLARPDATWSMKATAAMTIGRTAATVGNWTAATTGFERAVELLALTTRLVSDQDGQWHLLRFSGLASDAVACALETGDVQRAVKLFERGRGIFYNRALDLREDLSALTAAAPALAAQFAELRDQLNDNPESQRVALTREWEQLIRRIRELPGFGTFLHAPPLAAMLRAATDGPIVLLNVSGYRSDAIVLADNAIQVIPLPLLDPGTVEERYSMFTAALSPEASLARRRRQEEMATTVLAWLWEAVVGPVLDRLQLPEPCPPASLPRMWWCPSGLLSFLPLHAAGHHLQRGTGQPAANALDRVISSYIPMVRTLIRGGNTVVETSQIQALGVVLSEPVQGWGVHLPGAQLEGEVLRSQFPSRTMILANSDATKNTVLAALRDADVVHFACHGRVDVNEPADTGLILADGFLTVSDISKVPLTQGAVAYLSACGTARASEHLPDEPINLATAFLLSGYRNVVATLWNIDDRTATIVAEDFYNLLDSSSELTGAHIATALHTAVTRLRELFPTRPSVWASTIHVGS